MKLLKWLRSIFMVFFAVLSLFGVSLIVIFFLLFSRNYQEKARRASRIWGRLVCRLAGVRVSVAGGDHLLASQPYIYAANHQSQFDIPILAGFFGKDYCWMAKKELFKIPFFGRAMLAAGFIPVDRSHGRKAMEGLVKAAKLIAAGTSVIIFPEGTRSPDGRLLPFKSGTMVLAIKAGVPIVPIAIMGTHDILPKGKLLVRSGNVQIRVGAPIDTSVYKTNQKQELANYLREQIAALQKQV